MHLDRELDHARGRLPALLRLGDECPCQQKITGLQRPEVCFSQSPMGTCGPRGTYGVIVPALRLYALGAAHTGRQVTLLHCERAVWL